MTGKLRHVEVALEYPGEGLLELLIGEGVAKRVHGTVGVAEEVGEHEQVLVRAGRVDAEALDEGEYVVGRPAGDEGAQDEGDRSEGLAGPVLRPGLLPAQRRVLLLRLGLEPFADGLDEVATRATASRIGRLVTALARQLLQLLVRLLRRLLQLLWLLEVGKNGGVKEEGASISH